MRTLLAVLRLDFKRGKPTGYTDWNKTAGFGLTIIVGKYPD
jgi:hypothetical protein